jgi:hypothetical protein
MNEKDLSVFKDEIYQDMFSAYLEAVKNGCSTGIYTDLKAAADQFISDYLLSKGGLKE